MMLSIFLDGMPFLSSLKLTFGTSGKVGGTSDVKITQLCVPRAFLDQIGFSEAIRKAIRVPTDPALVQLFQKLAPNFDWSRAQTSPRNYQPPRWMGYWYSHSVYWASDGVLKLAIQDASGLAELFRQIQETHFTGKIDLPFLSESRTEPPHMILHDSEPGRIYVAPFEQAEAVLMRQIRPLF